MEFLNWLAIFKYRVFVSHLHLIETLIPTEIKMVNREYAGVTIRICITIIYKKNVDFCQCAMHV